MDPSRIRTTRRAFVLGAASIPLVAACTPGSSSQARSGAPGGKTAISWTTWSTAEKSTQEGTTKLVQAFEAANPDITVNVETIPFADTGNQLLLRLRSGNPPDVAQTSGNVTMALAASGGLAQLDEFSGDYDGKVLPAVRDLGVVDGKLMAVPKVVAPFGFWYNKPLLEKAGVGEPPTTIDDFEKALAAVKKADPSGIPFGLDTTNRDFGLDQVWAWMALFGAQPMTDGQPVTDPGHYTAFLDWMRGLSKSGYISPNQKIGYFRPLAAQNKVAFTWDGPYLKGVIQQANSADDETFYDTWGVSVQPTGPDQKSHTVPSDHQLVMFAKSQNKPAAWKFMEFLSASEEAANDYIIPVESALPAIAEPEGRTAELLDTPVMSAFRDEIVPTVERPGWGPLYSKVANPVMAAIQRAVTGGDPTSAIAGDLGTALGGVA